MSDEFVRRLRDRVDATAPEIPIETALVVPRARRRRALMRSVGTLAVVAVLSGTVWTAGAFWPARTTSVPIGVETGEPAGVSPVPAVPADQRAGLFGVWKVTAAGEGTSTFLALDVSDLAHVWRDCGVLTATWAVGPTRFVGYVSGWSGTCTDGAPSQSLPWLEDAAYYRAHDDGWQLLDARGTVLATLRHDGAPASRPDVSDDLARPPVVDDAARAWVSDPAALRPGLTPVTADRVVGRWQPTASGGAAASAAFVDLGADGLWTGSDGCNRVSGRWATDLDGRLVAVGGATTLMLCNEGAPLPDLLITARRAALSGNGDLLLFNAEGTQVAQLTRDGPAKETAEPMTTPSAGDPIQTSLPTESATLTVTCGAGTLVSESGPSPVVATSAGVRMVVQNDGAPAGTRLHIPITGGGWFERELPTTPTEWVLPLQPGPIHLSCWTRGTTVTTWGDLTVTVADPGGFYRSTTLDDLGCGGGRAYLDDGGRVLLDDVAPQKDHWVTARQAVEAWFSVLPSPASLTAERAPMGYPDAPVQIWLLLRDGKPYLWLAAWDAGGGFTTAAGSVCPAA